MLQPPFPLLAGALFALAATAGAQDARPAWPQPDQVQQRIETLSAQTNVERILLGKSSQGRAIEALRFSAGEPASNQPSILVVGNVTGDRLVGTEIALRLADQLAQQSEANTMLMNQVTIYIVPSANPDAAALRFQTPLLESTATGMGRDVDRDGLIGEDPPADINGDGLITWMRVPDVAGEYIADPFDARLTVKADGKHGERGMWKLIREGLDQDGDDEIAEDQPRDTELNRNFPAGYTPHTASGGLYGGSEPEARALMDFVLMHPELALIVTLDAQDTLASAPETGSSSGRIPNGKVLDEDAALLAEIGRRYTKTAKDAPKADSLIAGSFQRWAYEQRGILTVDSAIWELPKGAPKADRDKADDDAAPEAPADGKVDDALTELGYVGDDEVLEEIELEEIEFDDQEVPDTNATDLEDVTEKDAKPDTWRKASDDVERLKWVDATGESWRFVDWQAFEHPTLGPVEIGGWAPYALVEPRAQDLDALTDRHMQLLTSLGALMPSVTVTQFEATSLGKNLWRIEARLENPGLLPVVTAAANRARTATRTRVVLHLPDNAEIIVGQATQFVSRMNGLGQSGRDSELEWLVHTKNINALRLTVTSHNAGNAEANITRHGDQRQKEGR